MSGQLEQAISLARRWLGLVGLLAGLVAGWVVESWLKQSQQQTSEGEAIGYALLNIALVALAVLVGLVLVVPMLQPRRRHRGRLAVGLGFLGFASISWLIGAGFVGQSSAQSLPGPSYGTLSGEVRLSGALGGDMKLTGSCDDLQYGTSNWIGRLTLADGRPAIVELQPSADGVGIAVLPNDTKDNEIGGLIPFASSPSGRSSGASVWAASGTINAPQGPVAVQATWACSL